MPNNIDISGLANFKNTLFNVKRKLGDENTVTSMREKINKIALEEIEDAYSDTQFKVVRKDNKYETRIIAKGDEIAFDEFGTGFYAKGTYEGELPKQKLTFKSAGQYQTTQGWEHYYFNEKTKTTLNGRKGWFIRPRPGFPRGSFHTGKVASNRFYRRCKIIRERIRKELTWLK